MKQTYIFGNFLLKPQERALLCDGKPVSLTPKAFELLVVLVERSGRLVEKRELLRTVWPEVFVDEANLAVIVSQLRKTLGDDRETHEFIETIPRHGYRFVAPVMRSTILPSAEELSKDPPPGPGGLLSVKSSAPVMNLFRRRRATYVAFGLMIALICVAGLMWASARRRQLVGARPIPIQSVAILPFQDMGGPVDNDYLGDGIADAVITRLSGLETLVVRPTSVVERYQKSQLNPVQIGHQQSVDAVLEGQMQRQGDSIRLTVQLVRTRDGATLWADTFDEKFTNIFALEDEISERVAQSLQIRLSSAGIKRMVRMPTQNTVAYDIYLKGRYFCGQRTIDSFNRGLEYFRQSVSLDAHFAKAYAGIAEAYAMLGRYGSMPPDQAFPAAREAALKALSMDNSIAEAHATLGMIYLHYDADDAAAEDEFQQALKIDPHYAMAHSWSGEALAAMGRFHEAVQEAQRAMDDDPISMIIKCNTGWTYFLAGQTSAATQILQEAIKFDPGFPRTYFRMGIIDLAGEHPRDAAEEFQKAAQLSNGDLYYEASLAYARGESGQENDARRVLQILKNRARVSYVPAFDFALVYAGLHQAQEAAHWLQKASADRSISMAFAKFDPQWRPSAQVHALLPLREAADSKLARLDPGDESRSASMRTFKTAWLADSRQGEIQGQGLPESEFEDLQLPLR